MIFESLSKDHVDPKGPAPFGLTDIVCLALVNVDFWAIGEIFIRKLLAQARAPWAGTQILCIGEAIKDLPLHLELAEDIQEGFEAHSSGLTSEPGLDVFSRFKSPYRFTNRTIGEPLRQLRRRLQGHDMLWDDAQDPFLSWLPAWDRQEYRQRLGFQPSIVKLVWELGDWALGRLFADDIDPEDASTRDGEDGGEKSTKKDIQQDHTLTPEEAAKGRRKAEKKAHVEHRRKAHDVFVLRNYTKGVFVRGSVLPPHLTLGKVLVCFTGWSSKGPYETAELAVHRGPWAGDRFDVCEAWRMDWDSWYENVDGKLRWKWEDVSWDVVEKINGLCDWSWWRRPLPRPWIL